MRLLSTFLCLVLIFSLTLCITQARGEAKMIDAGKKVKFNYTLKADGEKIDSSEKNGPFEYVQGEKKIIPGLEKQMEGLKVRDKRTINVSAKEAYGEVDPNAFKEVPKSKLAPNLNPKVGDVLGITDPDGNNFPVVVAEVKTDSIVLNFNHPLAGKDLVFDITVVDIQ